MELRAYWAVLRRRWLFALIPAAIVLLLGVVTYSPAPPAYNVGVRFIVGQTPAPDADQADEQRYYNWLTSEYIVNGLTDWVRGGTFAAAVSAELADRGLAVPPGAIQVAADNTRSQMVISVSGGDPEQLAAIIDAAIVVLREENAAGLPQLNGEPALLIPLDEPVVTPVPAGLRAQLELPLRLALAVAAGIGLAFLIEYLDPTVRDRADLETIGLAVLGEIPKK